MLVPPYPWREGTRVPTRGQAAFAFVLTTGKRAMTVSLKHMHAMLDLDAETHI